MDEKDFLARRFDEHRGRLRAISYRMLGSLSEADDAVQDAWVRLQRSDADAIENLGAWLTTVVARVCLNMLRARKSRAEEPLGHHTPDPVIGDDPEHELLLADAVGLALQVVLETLSPAERVAFVLHDMFAVPFVEIAPMVNRTPAAARQLASRARRRIQDAAPVPDADLARQREVADAFHAAASDGDFARLVAVLDPGVVLRVDLGSGRPPRVVHGPEEIAKSAIMFAAPPTDDIVRPAIVNGTAGQIRFRDGRPFAVLGFTIAAGRVKAIDILANSEQLATLDISALGS